MGYQLAPLHHDVKPTARQLAALKSSLAAKEAAFGHVHVVGWCRLNPS